MAGAYVEQMDAAMLAAYAGLAGAGAALVSSVVVPSVTYLFGKRHERQRWNREQQWTVYVTLMASANLSRAAFRERVLAHQEGRQENHLEGPEITGEPLQVFTSRVYLISTGKVLEAYRKFTESINRSLIREGCDHDQLRRVAWERLNALEDAMRSELGASSISAWRGRIYPQPSAGDAPPETSQA